LSESRYPGLKDLQDENRYFSVLSESGFPGFEDLQDENRYFISN
jgi:hypothetical protein